MSAPAAEIVAPSTEATAAAPAAASAAADSSTSASSSSSSAAPAAAAAAAPSGSRALEARTVALSGDQIAYLGIMLERYKLGSLDKVARCLVNYADKDGDHRFIFATYRCRKCGIRFPKKPVALSLYPWQWAFLDRMQVEHSINDPNNDGKPLRCLLDFTQEGRCKRGATDAERAVILQALEKDIFEKIRCNDPVCNHQH